jgi:hypothetical protein
MYKVRDTQLWPLLCVTLLNYVAQIPYYLINYYFPYHVLPTLSSTVLLGITLVWFLIGYIGLKKRKPFGTYVLLSFLTVEALFYFRSIIFGAFFFQMQNPDLIIRSIFMYGYVSGFVAAWYVFLLMSNWTDRPTK